MIYRWRANCGRLRKARSPSHCDTTVLTKRDGMDLKFYLDVLGGMQEENALKKIGSLGGRWAFSLLGPRDQCSYGFSCGSSAREGLHPIRSVVEAAVRRSHNTDLQEV